MRLQAVELVERAVHGQVGDEVEGVFGVCGGVAGGFVDEGRGAREGVVRGADFGGVTERVAAEGRVEGEGEVFE